MTAAALALTLTTTLGDCALDTATVEVIPPATFRVLAVVKCGGVTCWTRFVQTDGKRVGETTACEHESGDRLSTGYPK